MPTWLFPLLLLLITRDGLLHRFDGHHDTTQPAPHAVALALVDGKLALLAGGKLTVDGKALPGKFADVRALAGGHRLWALAGDRAERIDLKSGRREVVLERPRLHRIAADGDELFAESDGEIQTDQSVCLQKKTDRSVCSWKLPAKPIALAAGDGKLFAATKEGPLWEIDRKTGAQRQLVGIGDWWGTLALAYSDGQLYAVTLAGKIWRIDPGDATRHAEKTIVAMDGWQGAVDLAVLR